MGLETRGGGESSEGRGGKEQRLSADEGPHLLSWGGWGLVSSYSLCSPLTQNGVSCQPGQPCGHRGLGESGVERRPLPCTGRDYEQAEAGAGQMETTLTIKAILTPNPCPLAGHCRHFV